MFINYQYVLTPGATTGLLYLVKIQKLKWALGIMTLNIFKLFSYVFNKAQDFIRLSNPK